MISVANRNQNTSLTKIIVIMYHYGNDLILPINIEISYLILPQHDVIKSHTAPSFI